MASPKNGNTYIYSLAHPVTLEIRYIGKTEYPINKRFNEHICRAYRDTYHVSNWTRKLLEQGLKPLIEIIEINPKNLLQAEIDWIAQFRAWGYRLTNHTIGGEGCKGIKWSYEAKLAFYQRHGGRPVLDNLGNRYVSVNEAGRELGINPCRINAVVKNKNLTAAGRTFWYEGDAPKTVPTKEERQQLRILKNKRSKSFTDQFGIEYRNVRDACEKLNIHKSCVLGVLKRRASHADGYIFTYKNEISPPFKTREQAKNEPIRARAMKCEKAIIDQNGNIYNSLKEASEKLEVNWVTISNALRGKTKNPRKGFILRYLNEEGEKDDE